MILAWKKRLAAVLLAAFAIWPAVHFGLYRAYGIDPWKLGGWAMYAQSRRAQRLGLFALEGDRVRPLSIESPQVEEEVRRLGRLRGALGELVSMEPLGRILLRERPDLEAVRIVVRDVGLDCATGRITVLREYVHDVHEDASGGRVPPQSSGQADRSSQSG